MKKLLLSVLALSLLVMTSCDVDQKKEAKLPEVDVDVDLDGKKGQLPSFDVNWADVNVGTTTKTVKVPKVVVVMEEVEVEVPYVDVDMPNDSEFGEKEERTILVEAEVEGVEHELDIEKIYANKNNLVVVSTLEKGETSLGDKKLRISDQVTLNAPDLNVRHYIVGERPNRMYNRSYRYFSTMDEVEQQLKGYTVIYD